MNEMIQLRIRWRHGHPFISFIEDGEPTADGEHAAEEGFRVTPPDADAVIQLLQDWAENYRRKVVPDWTKQDQDQSQASQPSDWPSDSKGGEQ